ncbi:hypothetical protein OQA88_11144 [Cercophora sp. LCS_1]
MSTDFDFNFMNLDEHAQASPRNHLNARLSQKTKGKQPCARPSPPTRKGAAKARHAAAAGAMDAGIIKRKNGKVIKSREKKALIEITANMTEEEKRQAREENIRLRNGESAAKSRFRKLLTLVERDTSATKLGRNSALLEELLQRCEALVVGTATETDWKATRGQVLQRYGFPSDAKLNEILYRRDTQILPLLADPIETRNELGVHLAQGKLQDVFGLDFAELISRVIGIPVGDRASFDHRAAQDRLLDDMRALAKAQADATAALGAIRKKDEAQQKKLRSVEESLPHIRHTADKYGLGDVFERLFPSVVGRVVEGVGVLGVESAAGASGLTSSMGVSVASGSPPTGYRVAEDGIAGGLGYGALPGALENLDPPLFAWEPVVAGVDGLPEPDLDTGGFLSLGGVDGAPMAGMDTSGLPSFDGTDGVPMAGMDVSGLPALGGTDAGAFWDQGLIDPILAGDFGTWIGGQDWEVDRYMDQFSVGRPQGAFDQKGGDEAE